MSSKSSDRREFLKRGAALAGGLGPATTRPASGQLPEPEGMIHGTDAFGGTSICRVEASMKLSFLKLFSLLTLAPLLSFSVEAQSPTLLFLNDVIDEDMELNQDNLPSIEMPNRNNFARVPDWFPGQPRLEGYPC